MLGRGPRNLVPVSVDDAVTRRGRLSGSRRRHRPRTILERLSDFFSGNSGDDRIPVIERSRRRAAASAGGDPAEPSPSSDELDALEPSESSDAIELATLSEPGASNPAPLVIPASPAPIASVVPAPVAGRATIDSADGRGSVPIRPNWWLRILLLIVVSGATAVGAWAAWDWRRRAPAQALLAEIDVARQQRAWRKVRDLIESSRGVGRDEPAIQGALAEAILKTSATRAESTYAAELFEKALAIDPTNESWRMGRVRALAPTEPRKAIEAVGELAKERPNDVAVAKLKALTLEELWRNEGAAATTVSAVVAAYKQCLANDRGDLESAVRLATLYREHATELARGTGSEEAQVRQRADWVIDEMVMANPQSAAARMARYHYRQQATGAKATVPGSINEDVREAIKLDPNNAEARLSAARQLLGEEIFDAALPERPTQIDSARLDETEEHLRRALSSEPDLAAPYLGLATVLVWKGKTAEAGTLLHDGVLNSRDRGPALLTRWTSYLVATGDFAGAREALARLEKLAPAAFAPESKRDELDPLEASIRLSIAAMRIAPHASDGDPRKAEATLVAIIGQRPGGNPRIAARVAATLADIESRLGEDDLAVDNLTRALALTGPNADLLCKRAEALQRQGRFGEASDDYAQSLKLAKGGESTHFSLPRALFEHARCELARQRRLAANKRKGDAFLAAIAALRQVEPDSPSTALLEAFGHVVLGGHEATSQIRLAMEPASRRFAEIASFWEGALALWRSLGDWERATSAIGEIERLRGRPLADLRRELEGLKHAGFAGVVPSSRELADPRRHEIFSTPFGAFVAMSPTTPEPSDDLLGAATQVVPAAGGFDLTRTLRACADRDTAELDRLIALTRPREDQQSIIADALEVYRDCVNGKRNDRRTFERVTAINQSISIHRPNWVEGRLLAGIAAEEAGLFPEAERHYRLALRVGSLNAEVAPRLIALLARRGRVADAAAAFDRLDDEDREDSTVVSLAIRTLAALDRADDAIALAKSAVAANPANSLNRLYLAASLARKADAASIQQMDDCLQTALTMGAPDARLWFGALAIHLDSHHPLRAARLADLVVACRELFRSADLKVRDATATVMMGFLADLRGDFVTAGRLYASADREDSLASPRSWRLTPPTLLIDSTARAAAEAAADHARSANDTTKRWIALLTTPETTGDLDASLNQRFLTADLAASVAMLLAQGGPTFQKRAIAILEKAPATALGPGERLVWARLCSLEGRDNEASRLLADGLQGGDIVAIRVELARADIRRREFVAAREQIHALASLEPQSADAAALRVILAVAQQESAAAAAAAKEYAHGQRADRLTHVRRAIAWLGQAGLGKEAASLAQLLPEGRERDLATLDAAVAAGDGEAALATAKNLAETERALEIVGPLARMMRQGPPAGVDKADIAVVVGNAFARAAKVWSGLGPLASRGSLMVEGPEAWWAIEQIASDPTAPATLLEELTRLALGERSPGEPLTTPFNRIILSGGPRTAFTTAKARAALAEGDHSEAMALLERAVAAPDASASDLLSLAEAYARGGLDADARRVANLAK